jgi:AcrR family transcriptional regulator
MAALKPSTKDLLIATSELLFSRSGINGVSLREIGAAAGQTNSNVVQYHFRDKRGLVAAIMNDRLRRLETARCEMLRQLEPGRADQPRARALLRLLWEPLMSVKAADGDHTFCRFLLQYLLQPQGPEHPSRDVDAYHRSRKTPPELPCLGKIRRLLRANYPTLGTSRFHSRLTSLSMMFLAAIVEHDNARLLRPRVRGQRFDIEPMLDLAIAGLGAPVSKRVVKAPRRRPALRPRPGKS